MTSSLDFGRKILMKRMVQALEGQGYRVEFAEDYNGYIVAGQGEDPAVMLLDADTIESQRQANPGSADSFVGGILRLVQSQITSHGGSSLQPPAGQAEAMEYADVPASPPAAIGVDEDMIMEEEPVADPGEAASEEVPVDDLDEPVPHDVSFDDAPVEDLPVEDLSEKERIEEETTEELTLEDFDGQQDR